MKDAIILVVDDQPDIIQQIVDYYEETNPEYTIYQAFNGEQGWQIASQRTLDLIITDWEMPVLNGIEFIKRLKQYESTRNVPIIMATGVMISSQHLQTALEAGAADFIRKPIDRIELMARSQSMLQLRKSFKTIEQKNALIASQFDFLQQIIDHIPNPIFYYEPDGNLLGCNNAFKSLFGPCPGHSRVVNIYEVFTPQVYSLQKEKDNSIPENGNEALFELEIGDDDSARQYIQTKTRVNGLGQSHPIILNALTDITELQKANHELLEHKKRELTASTLRLIQYNERNNALLKELARLNPCCDKKGTDILRGIVTTLQNQSGDYYWKEFQMHFEATNTAFYEKLTALFPDLTPNERKLCAFLRMNMSSKEIAAITFQSTHSIDIARYRLRKKLDLDKDENLSSFLMSI